MSKFNQIYFDHKQPMHQSSIAKIGFFYKKKSTNIILYI